MIRPSQALATRVVLLVAAACSGPTMARARAPATFFTTDSRDGSVEEFVNSSGLTYTGTDVGAAGTFVEPRGIALQNITGSNPPSARLWAADLAPNAAGSQLFAFNGATWAGVGVPNQSSLQDVNSIAFNNTGNLLFVASTPGATAGGGNVYEYAAFGTSLTLLHTFAGSAGGQIDNPTGLFFSPTGAAGTLFETSAGSTGHPGSIQAIDVATNSVTTLASGLSTAEGPSGVYYRTDFQGKTYADVANTTDNVNSVVEYTLSGAGARTSRTIASGLAQPVDPFYSDGKFLYVTGYDGSISGVPLTNPAIVPLRLTVDGSDYTAGQYSQAVVLPAGVSLATVPEPSSVALLGLGMVGLLGYLRARTRRPALA